MNVDPLILYPAGIAVIGILGGVAFSRRPGQSLLRSSLLHLASAAGFATITVLLIELYSAVITDGRAIPSLELVGTVTAIVAAGSLIACVAVFFAACFTAVTHRGHAHSESNDA